MRRREFIATIGSAAVSCQIAWPLAARAQQAARNWRIGFLGAATAAKYAKLVDAFRAGLRDFGYVEGKNLTIEFRWAEGNTSRLPEFAVQLVKLNIDCLVTHGTPGTAAAEKANTAVPIVMAVSGDAVATGLIKSLAQPGGNVTGTTFFGPELAAKRLELFHNAIPRASQLAVLVNPDNPVNGPVLQAMARTAATLKINLQQFVLRNANELDDAFGKIAAQRLDGVAVFEDAITVGNTTRIAQLAAKERLPMTGFAELAKAGGLIGYGADLPALFRRAAYFVDKILRGEKPSDIPVEQPTEFETVVNLKTAKALGVVMAPSLVATADEVIE